MRLLAIAVLLAGLSMAFTVRPEYHGVQVTGGQGLPEMNVDILIDCDSKELAVTLTSNETGAPLPDGRIYLFYTDYIYQLVANTNTGSDGTGRIVPMGKRNYLTDLFILRADHAGFRSTEIEFTYRRCFDAPPVQPPPAGNMTPGQNLTPGNASGPGGYNATQNATPGANQTPPANGTPRGNASVPAPDGNASPVPGHQPAPPGGAAGPCLPAVAMLLAIPLLAVRR